MCKRENILGSEVAQGFGDVVRFNLFPDPFQQFPFGRTLTDDVDLITKNESPNQTQNELQLSIHNIWVTISIFVDKKENKVVKGRQ